MTDRRLWDWRFIASITVMMAVVFVIYAGVTGQSDSTHKSEQIAALVTQNAQDTREFNTNQQHLLADQHDLLAYTQALAERQNAILAYLSAHGVKIPKALLRPIRPPTLIEPSSSTPSVAKPKVKAKPRSKVTTSPTPKAPAPTPRGRPSHPHPHPRPPHPTH